MDIFFGQVLNAIYKVKTTITNIRRIIMGLVAKKVAPVVAVEEAASVGSSVEMIDVSIINAVDKRILKIELPKTKKITDEDIDAYEEEHGIRPVAVCDATNEMIFKDKNVFILRSDSPEREELTRVFSTKFVKKLVEALEAAS